VTKIGRNFRKATPADENLLEFSFLILRH